MKKISNRVNATAIFHRESPQIAEIKTNTALSSLRFTLRSLRLKKTKCLKNMSACVDGAKNIIFPK